MAQRSLAHGTAGRTQGDQHGQGKNLLGPLLCWAVVFADIGISALLSTTSLVSSIPFPALVAWRDFLYF